MYVLIKLENSGPLWLEMKMYFIWWWPINYAMEEKVGSWPEMALYMNARPKTNVI